MTGKVYDEITVEADSEREADEEATRIFRNRYDQHFDEVETDVEVVE
jgi:hypothetical protein